MNTLRINCIQVTVDSELNVSFRLALPVKKQHINLLDRDRVKTYVRNGKIRYQYVVESTYKDYILKCLTAAQLLINDEKIKEMKQRHNYLMNKLSQLS